jgi:protein-disulfide isomerase
MISLQNRLVNFYKRIRLNPDPDIFTLVVLISIISVSLSFYNNYQIRNGGYAPTNVTANGKKILPVKDLIKKMNPDAQSIGSKDAKVVVVAFEDFQCPYCKRSHDETYSKLKTEYIDTGKVLFVHYDLAFLGPESISSSNASLCAAEQNKFWQYRDALYKNQVPEHNVGNFSSENLSKYAKSIGMDVVRFDECISLNKFEEEINKNREFAESYGIGSTPTFVINGQLLKGARPYTELSTIINNLLNK